MKSLSLLILLGAAMLASTMLFASVEANMRQFSEFQRQYNKYYSAEDFLPKYNVFVRNLKGLEKFVKEKTDTDEAEFGITEFFDLTDEEFAAQYLPKGKSN